MKMCENYIFSCMKLFLIFMALRPAKREFMVFMFFHVFVHGFSCRFRASTSGSDVKTLNFHMKAMCDHENHENLDLCTNVIIPTNRMSESHTELWGMPQRPKRKRARCSGQVQLFQNSNLSCVNHGQ